MHIKINGKPEETQETTLMGLLKSKDIEPRMVTVELNSKISLGILGTAYLIIKKLMDVPGTWRGCFLWDLDNNIGDGYNLIVFKLLTTSLLSGKADF